MDASSAAYPGISQDRGYFLRDLFRQPTRMQPPHLGADDSCKGLLLGDRLEAPSKKTLPKEQFEQLTTCLGAARLTWPEASASLPVRTVVPADRQSDEN